MGVLIFWQVFTIIAFITSASIIAGDKPYCVMVYNEEYEKRQQKVGMLANKLYEERLDKALEGVDNPNKRGEIINQIQYEARDEAYATIPDVSQYLSFEGWKNLWLPNLFNSEEGEYKSAFYAILSIEYNPEKKFYNWSHFRQSFLANVKSGNWGYPRKITCTPKQHYLIKKLF